MQHNHQQGLRPIPQQDVVQLWTYFFVDQPGSWTRNVASSVELAVFAGPTTLYLSHSAPHLAGAPFARELTRMGRLVLSGANTFRQMLGEAPGQCAIDMANGKHVYVLPFITYESKYDGGDEVNSIVAVYGHNLVNVVAFEFEKLSHMGWDELERQLRHN
jgi:hypothetical protein